MSKEIIYKEDALLSLVEGAVALAKAVKITYGPRGRQVAVKNGSRVFLTRDGATVADHVSLPDAASDVGAQLLRTGARRTAELAGDGSTTTVVLAECLLRGYVKAIVAGIPPLELRAGLLEAHRACQQELRRMSQPCESAAGFREVASLSLRNDAEMGELVSKAF
jgi:chaperonin GroEL